MNTTTTNSDDVLAANIAATMAHAAVTATANELWLTYLPYLFGPPLGTKQVQASPTSRYTLSA